MVVYYFQVTHQLPSLHEEKLSGNFATHFATGKAWTGAEQKTSLAELLRGFFDFYANHFVWTTEVVSVRLGRREFLEETEVFEDNFPCLENKLKGKLHIEDPIDLGRNLNFALWPWPKNLESIQREIRWASKELSNGCSLSALKVQTSLQNMPDNSSWTRRVVEGFLPLPDDPAETL